MDGAAATAQFFEPGGLSVAGNTLYVADTNNHAIRTIDLATKQVSTLTIAGLDAASDLELPSPRTEVTALAGPIDVPDYTLAVMAGWLAAGVAQSAVPLPAPPAAARAGRRIVILISARRASRWDYLDRFAPPTLSRLAADGVRAEGLIPQFPSKTFPNHYTIVTGLTLAHHGIVSNNMRDPHPRPLHSMSNREVLADPRWWGGEPIWNTAERQGTRGRGDVLARIGSRDRRPRRRPTGSRSTTTCRTRDRVNQLLEWLKLPEGKRPSFLTLVLQRRRQRRPPLRPGLRADVANAVLRVDRRSAISSPASPPLGLGRSRPLRDRQRPRHGGAQPRPHDRARRLHRRRHGRHRRLGAGARAGAEGWRRRKDVRGAQGQASALAGVSPSTRFPAVYGLAGHPRLPPIVGIADEGWYITSKTGLARWDEPDRHAPGGTHGYDARASRCRACSSPTVRAFRSGVVVKPFENIHSTNFMCAVMGIAPATNDGDPAVRPRDMPSTPIDDRKFRSHYRRRLAHRAARQPRRHARVLRLRHLRRLRARHRRRRSFPTRSPIASLMASFAAFAAGYLARPIGGIVLSHYGDRYGRRTVFLWSVFVMSAATLGMGLVPSYAQWGVAASALMVALRLLQGFCLGGELPGALTYVVETAPRIAPFVCGVVFACVTMGVAVATGVSLSVRTWLAPDAGAGLRLAHRVRASAASAASSASCCAARSRSRRSSSACAAWRRGSRSATCCARTRRRCWSAARCWPARRCFNGLFFSHLPAYLSGVLQYDPRQAVFSQTVGVIASAARHSADRLDWRSHSAALPAAHRRRAAAGVRVSVLRGARDARR